MGLLNGASCWKQHSTGAHPGGTSSLSVHSQQPRMLLRQQGLELLTMPQQASTLTLEFCAENCMHVVLLPSSRLAHLPAIDSQKAPIHFRLGCSWCRPMKTTALTTTILYTSKAHSRPVCAFSTQPNLQCVMFSELSSFDQSACR